MSTKRCIALTCTLDGKPRVCSKRAHPGDAYCLEHAAMFVSLVPPELKKAAQR